VLTRPPLPFALTEKTGIIPSFGRSNPSSSDPIPYCSMSKVRAYETMKEGDSLDRLETGMI
jgi:hypothetical protein